MQQPIILFNGGQHKVGSLNYHNGKPSYVIAEIEGKMVEFYDTSNKTYLPKDNVFMVDLEKLLIFVPSTIRSIYEALANKIVERENELSKVAREGMRSDFPFPEAKQKFHEIEREIVGLLSAAEIVEGYMEVKDGESK